ncbi:RNA polymerase sigma factor [Kutzneria buriramensis]|uniref:RNA polymerase sigma-70 factor (ECF subfamily) n=1 Tax=Kutzneria buriramensis TaxID=1045776 RepID=A0A3E0GY38_9PSEU|nr:sigma-70 family RNA polymerase sigma factor [Kutzneria buriramensis]REH31183.1 RNA polymerase sigma-70 factor (ECF subfamily) [Kutzneria buriramensis]
MNEPDQPQTAASAAQSAAGDRHPGSQRDQEFAIFYRATTRPLIVFLAVQGARIVDAADIAQDTMAAAYKRWHAIDHPRAWVYRVASRALIRHKLGERETPVCQAPEPNPLLRAIDLDRWELREDIIQALAQLPRRQRQVMAWTLFDYTPAEIADELGLNAGTVRQHLHLARIALSAWLSRKEGNR